MLLGVEHGEQVTCAFPLAETAADALIAQLNEAGQGRLIWLPAMNPDPRRAVPRWGGGAF